MTHWSHARTVLPSVTLALCLAGAAHAADKVIFQATENDVDRWTLVLNNVRNLQKAVGADADVEIVAYGPGIQLLKAGSPIAARVHEALRDRVRVVACQNTMAGNHLTSADMLPDIGYVPSGVVEVMRRQQQGYSYIRP